MRSRQGNARRGVITNPEVVRVYHSNAPKYFSNSRIFYRSPFYLTRMEKFWHQPICALLYPLLLALFSPSQGFPLISLSFHASACLNNKIYKPSYDYMEVVCFYLSYVTA